MRDNSRLNTCPCCHCYTGANNLYQVRGRLMCKACGNKEIAQWNDMMKNDGPRTRRHDAKARS